MVDRSGHLFVVHGLIERVVYDAVVIPTDDGFHVERHWNELFGGQTPRRPADWPAPFARARDDARVWFISVFAERPVDGDELGTVVTDLLRRIATDVVRDGRRAVPLVAMPVLGIGAGGRSSRRGRAINHLVGVLETSVRDIGVDVALVTPDGAVFSAVQQLRRNENAPWPLTATELARADELGSLARSGRLALFLGAGVSVAAGLPSWKVLLERLAAAAGIDPTMFTALNDSALDQAELIAQRLGDRLGRMVSEIIGEAPRVSLAHALLAGLGCREVVTTNYDAMFESAVEATGRVRPAQIPWEAVESDRGWILKMHGDVRRPDTIVLTRRSFVRYDARFRPAGSILQALLVTHHLLVVGTSLTDDNVIRLAVEVDEFLAETPKMFGTFVDVNGAAARAQLWADRFSWHMCEGREFEDRARQMEIFLDAIAMYASSDARWLLDRRFEDLLGHDAQRCADTARDLHRHATGAGDGLLTPLKTALTRLGSRG